MDKCNKRFTATILLSILLFISQQTLRAHEPDQVDHMNRLSITAEGEVSLQYTVSHGEVLGFCRETENPGPCLGDPLPI